MKYLFSLLLLMYIAKAAIGQSTENYFPKSNADWYVHSYITPHGAEVSYMYHYFLRDSFTTINNHTYSCLLFNHNLQNSVVDGVYAYLRNDSLDRTYILLRDDSVERLLYDFALPIGDTIYDGTNYMVVESKFDSTIQGIVRECCAVRYSGYGYAYHHIWAQGIGNLSGPTFPYFYGFEGWNARVCRFAKDETVLYESSGYYKCDYLLGNTTAEVQDFEMYPNPTNSGLKIIVPHSYIFLKVFNTMGEKMFEDKAGDNYMLNVSSYSNGVYIVKLENANGKAIVKKFVKN